MRLANWTTGADEQVIVAPINGGTSNYSNNLGGIGIDVEHNSGLLNFVVTETTANGNQHGLRLSSDGVGTLLVADVVDNFGFNNNSGDGIRLVSVGGSTQRVQLVQPAGISGNGQSGVNLLAGSDTLGGASTIEFFTMDTTFTQNGVGMRAISTGDGQILANFSDVTFTLNQIHADIAAQNNSIAQVNRFVFDDVTMDNTFGLLGGGGDAIRISNSGTSLLDVVVTNSVITTSNSDFNPPGGGGTPLADTQAGFGEGQAFDLDLSLIHI